MEAGGLGIDGNQRLDPQAIEQLGEGVRLLDQSQHNSAHPADGDCE
jgi:hypothetical protein